MRIVTTDILRDMTAKHRVEYRLSASLLASLDPDGLHVVTNSGFMHDGPGIHMTWRGRVLIKLRGQDEPVLTFLDIPLRTYNTLPTAKEVQAYIQTRGGEHGDDRP